MDGAFEWLPDVQLKREVVPEEFTDYEEYGAEFGQDIKPRVKSKLQQQPVVYLEKIDLTSFNNGTCYVGDLQKSRGLREPDVDHQGEPYVDFEDSQAESTHLERKYVTSSLLSGIKVEEVEEGEEVEEADETDETDETGKDETGSKSAILRLVLKQESDVEFAPDSIPEIQRQDEPVSDRAKGDGSHLNIGGRDSNGWKTPVVLLERLDPVFVRHHLKTSESTSSSSCSAPPSFQLKKEGGSRFDLTSVHKHVSENQGTGRLSINASILSSQKEGTFSKKEALETFTSTTDTKKLHLTTSEKSSPRSSFNYPTNTSAGFTKSSRLNIKQLGKRMLKSGIDRHANGNPRSVACSDCSTNAVLPCTRDHLSPFIEHSPLHKLELSPSSPVMSMPKYDRPFSCVQCSRKFKWRASLRRHMYQGHNKDRKFSCDNCSSKFISIYNLKTHLKVLHSDKSPLFSCSQCSSNFNRKSNLLVHIRHVHNDERPFSCTQCSRKFKTRYALRAHVQGVHSEDRPFSCGQCSSKFKFNYILKKHVQAVHSEDRPFSCDECSKSFKSMRVLRVHIKYVHSEDRPFSCDECSKNFKSMHELRLHIKYVHTADRPFPCNECSSRFKLKNALNLHLKTVHTNNRQFSCNQCSSSFVRKSHLQIHILSVHNENRTFACSQCTRKYKTKRAMVIHIRRTHSNDSITYSCAHCSTKCKSKSDIHSHIIYNHSTYRPFSCDQCSAMYKTKNLLQYHTRTFHVSERPFICDQCPKTFKLSSVLKRHIACAHTSGRPFSCDTCSSTFKSKKCLQTHTKRVHP